MKRQVCAWVFGGVVFAAGSIASAGPPQRQGPDTKSPTLRARVLRLQGIADELSRARRTLTDEDPMIKFLSRKLVELARPLAAEVNAKIAELQATDRRLSAFHKPAHPQRRAILEQLGFLEKTWERIVPWGCEYLTLRWGQGVTMKLVLIPAGAFLMGSPYNEQYRESNEGPQRRATITRPFYMGICEVTQEQYKTVMGKNRSRFRGPRNPVEMVSWKDAVEFCEALSHKTGKTVRLPTEAEWEYACRAGTTTPFHTGQTISTDQANYDGNHVYGDGKKGVNRWKTVPVGSFKPNAWGLHDMHGNVWEWCSDWYADSYSDTDTRDPRGPASGVERVLRGGTYMHGPWRCRAAARTHDISCWSPDNGFRVVVASSGRVNLRAPKEDPAGPSQGSLAPSSPPKPDLANRSGKTQRKRPRPSGRGHSFVYKGPMPTAFGEAPRLAELVRLGRLPPVHERLPKDVLIVPPVERIGRYGGTWRRAFTGPADGQNADRLMHDHVLYYDFDGITLIPHIAKGWKASDDGRTFTFSLRRGMKWSDGHSFTADDFAFAYHDVMMNRELLPSLPSAFKSPGGYGRLRKIDEYTFQIAFPHPYHVFPEMVGSLYVAGQSSRGGRAASLYAPKHYLKKFHPKYVTAEELQARIKQAGVTNWRELYRLKANPRLNPELPVVAPWVMVEPINGDLFVFERNPYYWAVDPAGNQLPYIDRVEMRLAGNPEVLNMRAMGGELDMQHRHIHLANTPFFKEHGPRIGYDLLFWPGTAGSDCAVYINHSYTEDPEVAKWLQNIRFRIALSLAIDRDEINDSIFLGTGRPKSCVPPSGTPYCPGAEYETKYAVRDLVKACRILDDLGLKAKDGQGFRLRTDGKGRLKLSLEVVPTAFLDSPGIAELLSGQWRQVGLRVTVELRAHSSARLRQMNNRHQMTLRARSGGENVWSAPMGVVPCWPRAAMGPRFGLWYSTGGNRGVEPTGPSKKILDLYHRGRSTPYEKRLKLGKELWRTVVDTQYLIGLVDGSPAVNGVVIVRRDFRNVPLKAPNSSALQNPGIARTEQFFFDR